jgi:uncharacterized protein
MSVPITALYAAFCGVLIVILALFVVRIRRRERVGLSDGGNAKLARAIAVHRNAIEYVPIALVLFLIFELNGGQSWLLHAFGIILIVSRLLHAWGLSRHSGHSFGRYFGTAGTWVVILGLAGMNANRFFQATLL